MTSMYGCSDSSKVGGVRHITRSARKTGSFMLETLPSESVDRSSYHPQEEVSEIDNVADEDGNEPEDSLCHGLLPESRDVSHAISESSLPGAGMYVRNGVQGATDEFVRSSSASRSSSCEDQQYDARVRKGLQTIEKLDELLKIKSEREMEVKRERREMEHQFRMEIEEMLKSKGRDLVNAGANRLLELCACVDSERELITEEDYEPVFTTQVDFELGSGLRDADCGEESSLPDSSTDVRDGSPDEVDDTHKAPKNFIRRNIQLASHANEVIAMTDEERRRLDELLADETDLLFTDNPFRKQNARYAIGYGMTDEERDVIKLIDEKLSAIVPLSNLELMESGLGSSCSSLLKPLNLLDESDGSRATFNRNQDGGNDSNISMEVLMQRLALVDAELELLTLRSDANSVSDMADRLSPSSLRMLLDVDSRMTSSSLSSHPSERPISGSVQGSYPGSVDSTFGDRNLAAGLDLEGCKLESQCLDAGV